MFNLYFVFVLRAYPSSGICRDAAMFKDRVVVDVGCGVGLASLTAAIVQVTTASIANMANKYQQNGISFILLHYVQTKDGQMLHSIYKFSF